MNSFIEFCVLLTPHQTHSLTHSLTYTWTNFQCIISYLHREQKVFVMWTHKSLSCGFVRVPPRQPTSRWNNVFTLTQLDVSLHSFTLKTVSSQATKRFSTEKTLAHIFEHNKSGTETEQETEDSVTVEVFLFGRFCFELEEKDRWGGRGSIPTVDTRSGL